MKNKKYKIVEYDTVHNIWILKEKVFWFIYKSVTAGSKEVLEKFIKENE